MWFRATALLVLACACGPAVSGDDDVDATSTTGDASTQDASSATLTASDPSDATASTTGNPTTASTTVDPTNADSSDSGDTCGLFLQCFDVAPQACDLWAQDCLRGEKCMPWASDGGEYWDSTRCSPIDDMPAEVGDPCTVVGDSSMGVDNCALGSVCFFVDPLSDEGVCVAHCMGTAAEPLCEDPGTACVQDFDDVFAYCLPACDPIVQDCERGGCYLAGDETFACGPTIGVGLAGGSCSHDWDCVAGTICVDTEIGPGCPGGSCCASICDLAEPEPCIDGLVCDPLFPDDQSPFGICIAEG